MSVPAKLWKQQFAWMHFSGVNFFLNQCKHWNPRRVSNKIPSEKGKRVFSCDQQVQGTGLWATLPYITLMHWEQLLSAGGAGLQPGRGGLWYLSGALGSAGHRNGLQFTAAGQQSGKEPLGCGRSFCGQQRVHCCCTSGSTGLICVSDFGF